MPDMSQDHYSETRMALHAIVADPSHGVSALSNPQTMSNLLKDLLPDAPRVTGILVAAAEAGLANTLREHIDGGMVASTAIRLTSSSFSAVTMFPAEACDWVTGEIAIAMGVNVPGNDGSAGETTITSAPDRFARFTRPPAEPTPENRSNQHTAAGVTPSAVRPDPNATAPRRGLTRRRHIVPASIVLVLAAVGAGVGLWLSSSSPSHFAAAPRPSSSSTGPLKVDTCARTASGSSAPAHIGSITTGAAEKDFVDVAFSPDCQVVAAGGNGIVHEWDMVTGNRITTLPVAPGNAALIDAFTPNGKTLAVAGGNGNTTLWNATTGDLEARFPSDPSGGTYCLVISPDGTEIFTGGSTGVVGIWGVNTHQSEGTIPTGVAIGAMALSPDGKLLAVAGYDGIIRIYDTASRTRVATLHGDEGHIWSMAFSPDGSTLAAGSNVLQWWDVTTGKLIGNDDSPGGDVTDVAFNPHGTILAAGGYEMVGLWDADTRQLVTTLSLGAHGTTASASYPNGMSFSRYGTVLAVGCGGTLQFWNVADINGSA